MAWKKKNKGWKVEKKWCGEESTIEDIPLENDLDQSDGLPFSSEESSPGWGKPVTPDHIKRELNH
jgi:hypothetical protein